MIVEKTKEESKTHRLPEITVAIPSPIVMSIDKFYYRNCTGFVII